MKPILYPANTTNFTGEGLGHLSDAISCHVKESINGSFELEMVYPVEGRHFEDIQEGRIIYSAHDETGNPQPFDIYRISRPINRKVTVFAKHISYRLNDLVAKPFSADGLQTALAGLSTNVISVNNPFTFSSDKTNAGHFEVKVPTAVRSLMGGTEGSIIDVYGGEWEYDHFSCVLRNRRGQDNGVNIRYGKNLTDVKKVTDVTNLWTGIVPYWQGVSTESTEEIVVYYDGVIFSSLLHDMYPYDIITAVDASSSFDEPPTAEQLLAWGRTYVQNNAKTGIPLSVKISFVQLWQTEEYKDIAPLQRLRIGDTVTIFYEALGVDNVARISGYDYDVLLERYDSMTVGDIVSSLASTIAKDIKGATKDLPTKTFFELALDRATELITGGLGGHVVINRNENGQPNEVLFMNTTDKDTATRVMRINYEGIAFGSGYNGPFNSAWTTLDGTFDAQNINVINLNAGSIVTGILRDRANSNYWNMDTGEFRLASNLAKVDNKTLSDFVGGVAGDAADDAVDALTQLDIFNKLTNNGEVQGIYLNGGKLYLNASFMQTGELSAGLIKTGTMSADRIYGGTMKLGGLNNGNGSMEIYDSSGTLIGTIDNTGANLTGDITLRNDNVSVFTGYSKTFYWNVVEWLSWGSRNNFNIELKDNNRLITRIAWFHNGTQGEQQTKLTSNDQFTEVTAIGVSNIGSESTPSYSQSFVEVYKQNLYAMELYKHNDTSDWPQYMLSTMGIRFRTPNGGMRIGVSKEGEPIIGSTERIVSEIGTIYIESGNNKVDVSNAGIFIDGGSAYVWMESAASAAFSASSQRLFMRASAYSIEINSSGQMVNGRQIAFDSTSSKRYKHSIRPIQEESLNPHKLLLIPVKEFVYNEDASMQYEDMAGRTLPGFIAEDIEDIYPSAAIHNSKGEVESWDERRIVPGMLALIQEQHEQIKELQEKLSKLEERLAKLEDGK